MLQRRPIPALAGMQIALSNMNILNPDPGQYAAARGGTVYIRFNRGVLRGSGADRLDLLHRLSTNATRDLAPGDETSTILTSDKGRVVEVLRVIAFADHILMVLAGNDSAMVRAWLDKYTIMDDFTVTDAGADYALYGVYGDHAKSIIGSAFDAELPNAGKVATMNAQFEGGVILRDARLTGAGGFLLMVPAALAADAEARLAASGAVAVGQDVYDTLRIEAGIPAMGRDLTEDYNPLEAGLTQYISFTKGCYIGQEVIARLDTYDKVQRHLVGLTFDGALDAADAQALEVRDAAEGKKIGTLTSATYSPSMGRTIGLAYVRTAYAVPGARVAVAAAGSEAAGEAAGSVTASLTKLPFDV